ncbi:hypothetical protein JCGZ_26345 [Jatropha curcas]|uniref:Uncharacterized protein n=1 Tax=Jatropha curcas TaxID=180498 RepID=A0A067JSJ7_JATCU|nr:pentatricopeptide repeat-containing protein At1g08070, chloroplastic [Jatropha curcas]KDP22514.1 hypothetical protein JCGZ_26345 [Jatropha curcas]
MSKSWKYAPLPFLSNRNKFNLESIKCQDHFNQILSHAIVSGLFSDPFISSKLLFYSLSKTHDLSFSHSLFSQIQNPNIFAYNFMFKAYSHSSTPVEAITLYNLMLKNGTFPDNYTFPFIFKVCGRLLALNKGQEVHALSLKLGLEYDVFVQNALVSMYSFCGKLKIARRVFDEVPIFVRDVVSWNSMISGYVQCDCYGEALKLFGELIGDNCVTFDEVTLINALTACGRLGFLDLGRETHALIIVNRFVLDVFLGSSLIDMYAKCGQTEDARKVFDKIPERNLVCWTSIIVGYARLDMFKKAIQLFREMQLSGVIADAALVASVISACGHMGALDLGKWVHNYAERNDIDMNLSVRNALIDMYSKCGDIEKARQIFNDMIKRDVFSWTAMISGLAMNGNCIEALDLFEHMETSGNVKPNEVTYLGVLSACSHGGFVDQGFQYFKAMSATHHLTPRIEHYGCIIDLLGRANLIIEAKKFIREMPIQPDIVIWRSLLFACRSHGNIESAEVAINKIEELEPRRSEAHVLLSHVYALASRWGDMNIVRKRMARQKTNKQPGCSFVEINGFVHEFFAEDGSNSQIDVINNTIMQIHKVLTSEGLYTDVLDYQLQQ